MHRRILIPLDGSPLSERVLDPVATLLHGADARLVLLRVLPADLEAPGPAREAARGELEALRARLEARGVTAEAHLREGDPAAEILAVADERQATLIALASHGRSGIARWVRGSVAERLLRNSPRPLLLVTPRARPAPEGGEARFRRVLVPLDGSARAEQILPVLDPLARTHGAELVLFRVGWVDPVDSGLAYSRVLGVETGELRASLAATRERLELSGLRARIEVATGDPAREILAAAEALDVDLLALATHGRSGVDRWLFGSVAEHVLREARCPLLVVRTAGVRPAP